MESSASNLYQVFWKTWGVLLALTAIMVFVDIMHMPRIVLLLILLGAMLTKAFLIASRFMDLAHEKLVVLLTVAFSLLFFGGILYALMVPDGLAVLHGGR
jgi:cytochrome c oxidase subunit IV